jgi:DNA (cytosine-5)-methyltransferase 1
MRVVDLFAGCGGTSEGAREAGLDVVWAGNHWPAAVELHRRRHPRAIHVCQDLQQFDWRHLPDHEILWASPACQGHSEAGQPGRAADGSLAAAHDHLRTTAWAVIGAVLAKQPRAFVVENVPEFCEWRPAGLTALVCGGKEEAKREAAKLRAIERDVEFTVGQRGGRWCVVREFERGTLYRHWLATFRLAGYRIHESTEVRGGGQLLTASKWGVPQRRTRLIIVGHLERDFSVAEPDVAPEDEPTLAGVLDFTAGRWAEISSKRGGARKRLDHAHREFSGGPCWGWHVSHKGAWARSPHTPANTVTTKNQLYMVNDGRYRLWSVDETLGAMGFRRGYLDGVPRTAALVMAGNAVPPGMARGILTQVAESLR